MKKDKKFISIYNIPFIIGFFILFIGLTIIPSDGTGPSMYPTFNEEHTDTGIKTNKLIKINRYDIIDTKKLSYAGNERIQKRVIGLPGETITIKGNNIYINGKEFNDPAAFINKETKMTPSENINIYLNDVKLNIGEEVYLKNIASIQDDGQNNIYLTSEKTWTLGDDEYFVMGDNRCMSNDSREFGPIKKSDIRCKTLFMINFPEQYELSK